MTDRRAAVVTLGRVQGMGETRRVESWQMILDAAGFHSDVLRLRSECGSSLRRPPHLGPVLRGTAPPESIAWSLASARDRLRDLRPDLTVFVTLRAFSPALTDEAGVPVLDLVDRLSTSYRDRATVATSWRDRLWFSSLARTMARAERCPHPGIIRTAAGRGDAVDLDATWIPNVVDVPDPAADDVADHDLVFFGNLAYPPNVSAMLRLADWWPEVRRRRPSTTLLVTGRSPDPRVVEAASRMGAELELDYATPTIAARRGRVAVAPLAHAAGIQNKVIEAASAGVPQVLSPQALGGLPQAFPCLVADDGTAFADAVIQLLERPERRRQIADAALRVVRSRFTPDAWAPWVRRIDL